MPSSEFHTSYFHLWSHKASKSPCQVSPPWGAGVLPFVLFFFKAFFEPEVEESPTYQ